MKLNKHDIPVSLYTMDAIVKIKIKNRKNKGGIVW